MENFVQKVNLAYKAKENDEKVIMVRYNDGYGSTLYAVKESGFNNYTYDFVKERFPNASINYVEVKHFPNVLFKVLQKRKEEGLEVTPCGLNYEGTFKNYHEYKAKLNSINKQLIEECYEDLIFIK